MTDCALAVVALSADVLRAERPAAFVPWVDDADAPVEAAPVADDWVDAEVEGDDADGVMTGDTPIGKTFVTVLTALVTGAVAVGVVVLGDDEVGASVVRAVCATVLTGCSSVPVNEAANVGADTKPKRQLVKIPIESLFTRIVP